MKHNWKMILGIGGGVILAAVIAFLVWGNTWRMMLANRDFRSGKPDQAGAVYQEMAVDQPKSPFILHNQSLVAYEKAKGGPSGYTKYSAAHQFITKALQETANIQNMAAADRHKLYYQAGNAAFQTAATGEAGGAAAMPGNALKTAGNVYQEALQQYKKAIEADPQDRMAKYNYELTQLRLKQNQENQKRQPQENGKQDQKNNQKNKQKNASSDSGGGNKNQNDSGKPNSPDNRKNSQNHGNQPRPAGPMTKEEAEALLKMAGNGDQYQTPQARGAAGTPEKDW